MYSPISVYVHFYVFFYIRLLHTFKCACISLQQNTVTNKIHILLLCTLQEQVVNHVDSTIHLYELYHSYMLLELVWPKVEESELSKLHGHISQSKAMSDKINSRKEYSVRHLGSLANHRAFYLIQPNMILSG